MPLQDPVRGWLQSSLRNRAAFVMVGISMAAATFLAAAAFLASQRLIAGNTRQTHQAALAAFERQFDFESRALIRMLEAMARNAFVSNALVDSLGRDQYLLPFLRDQTFPGDWTGTLWLLDFKGRPIASNAGKSDFPYGQSAALQSALSSGRQVVESVPRTAQLLLATPVVFPPTRSIEGAVFAVVDLAGVLERSAALVPGNNCFHLFLEGAGFRSPRDCPLGAEGPVLSETLQLAGGLALLQPRLELHVATGSSLLGVYLLVYSAVVAAVFLAVLWASRRMAAHIVEPLSLVTEAANTIVHDDRLDLRVAASGDDEIGRLGRAFNHMVESLQSAQARMRDDVHQIKRAEGKLHALNAELEQRVMERTADLENTIVDLNRAREVAERANRAKSDFLSRMSHELRTPLNAILGFAQMLRIRGATLAEPERDRYVGQIESGGWYLLELINDLLDLSRIEAGTMLVGREPVGLQQLCAECIGLMQPLARAAGISLIDHTANIAPLFALGDRTRLSQVLTNLLSNAVKYNRKGGSVTLTLRAVDRDWIEVGVADTGRGFTPEQLRELYQPFNRLGADRVAVDGTGIGLVISKRLLEMMGGSLDLTTKEGAGALFTLRLVRAQPAEAAPEVAEAAPAHRSDATDNVRTVLCIEDNPSNVDLIEATLSLRPNVTMLAAADGPTGLALADTSPPDLILIDIALPGIDGYEVCRRLRARAATRATPILAISANATPKDIELGKAAGFDDYLTKPLDVKSLLSQVDRLLGNGAS